MTEQLSQKWVKRRKVSLPGVKIEKKVKEGEERSPYNRMEGNGYSNKAICRGYGFSPLSGF